MQNSFSLLFYLKKPKAYVSGTVPIYVRITVCSQREEVSTGRECLPEKWNSDACRMNGTKEEAKIINAYLDTLQAKVFEAHRQLLASGELITAETIKNKFSGKTEKARCLLPIFQDHNNKIAALIGEEFAPGYLRAIQNFFKAHH